jgi:hypothetical protein
MFDRDYFIFIFSKGKNKGAQSSFFPDDKICFYYFLVALNLANACFCCPRVWAARGGKRERHTSFWVDEARRGERETERMTSGSRQASASDGEGVMIERECERARVRDQKKGERKGATMKKEKRGGR